MINSLNITNLHAATREGKKILHGISLRVRPGETHAIMGPNGSGKSTLARAIMGDPTYLVTSGKIELDHLNVTQAPPDQKAQLGLFLGFQSPIEIEGVNFGTFLRLAINENQKSLKEKMSLLALNKLLLEQADKLAFKKDLLKRNLNEGFSGGEKKKAEVLQLTLLKPKYAILDEPDSGLDVDGLKYIAKMIKSLDYPLGLILITHYQRILTFIKPDFVHVLVNGKIVETDGQTLIKKIEEKGYEQYHGF